jgi:hypothetical protein
MAHSPNRWRLGLLAAAVGLLVGHALVFNFVNDDAFISFRYADNLVQHGELVFNLGDRVEGYTNFLWTLLMAGGMAMGIDPVPFSKGLGIVLSVITLLLVARFMGKLEGRTSAWDAVAPGLLAGAPAFACWSTGGLETALFATLLTASWTAYLTEDKEKFPLSGVWLALAAMTRPEGMLIFGLTGLFRLGEMLLVERTLRPRKHDWLWGIGFALVFAPYFVWRWWYYGWPFPNTYYVKTGAKNFWGRGFLYWWDWVITHALWILPGLAVLKRPKYGRFLALGGLYIIAVSVHVMRVGGDFMALHRFLMPLMPIAAVMAAMGLRSLVGALSDRGFKARTLAFGAALVVIGAGVQVARIDQAALKVDSKGGVDSIGWLAMFAEQCTVIGKWMAENTPPDASMAITAAGIIPYYSRRRTLDLLGLNDEWIAHEVKATGNRPGHTKHAPHKYVEEWAPTYFIGHPDPQTGRYGGRRRGGYVWKTHVIPGLRIDPRRARKPGDKSKDATLGFWVRK